MYLCKLAAHLYFVTCRFSILWNYVIFDCLVGFEDSEIVLTKNNLPHVIGWRNLIKTSIATRESSLIVNQNIKAL